MQFETERLTLRPFTPADAPDLYAYAKDPLTGPTAGWPPHQSVEESMQIIRMFTESGSEWAIVLRAENRVIGSVGLHRDPARTLTQSAALGYVVARRCWGMGIATEAARRITRHAFEGLHLEVLSAVHYSTNPRSGRVMEKIGMTREGVLRKATLLLSGEICDNVCYAITREEWASQNA